MNLLELTALQHHVICIDITMRIAYECVYVCMDGLYRNACYLSYVLWLQHPQETSQPMCVCVYVMCVTAHNNAHIHYEQHLHLLKTLEMIAPVMNDCICHSTLYIVYWHFISKCLCR